jgi:hypothetical protein
LYRQIGTESPKRITAIAARVTRRFVGEAGTAMPFETIRRTARKESTVTPETITRTRLAFVGFIFATRLDF